MELTPLGEAIDPEAISSLFSSPSTTTLELQFEYEGHTVTIEKSGEITLN